MLMEHHPDNPYHIYDNPKEWAHHEYTAGRGSAHGLHDYARRVNLMREVELDPNTTESVCAAMRYLLKLTK